MNTLIMCLQSMG